MPFTNADPIETEVLVIGAGPAGSTYARFLAEAGKRVLLLDTGAQFGPRPGVNLKNSFAYQRNVNNFVNMIQGLLHPISVPSAGGLSRTLDPTAFRPKGTVRNAQNPRQDASMNLDGAAAAYSVGGMALHWTGAVPRHHPTLERIQFIPQAEWNEHLYPAAEHLLNKSTTIFEGSIRNTIVRETLRDYYGDRIPSEYPVQNLPLAGQRRTDNDEFVTFTGTDRILAPIIDSDQSCNFAADDTTPAPSETFGPERR